MAGVRLAVIAACLRVMDRPWQWGAADCCTSACDVFLRLHGVDPMARLRGRYDSRLGALRLITQGGGFEAFIARECAVAGLVPSDGKPGDLGLITAPGGLALGICIGPGIWAGKSQTGMVTVPEFERAWRAA